MKRPGKPEGQYYLSHKTLDTDHGVILGVPVTPGDVHHSVPYLLPIQAATADTAYDFPLAHRVLKEQGISFYVRPQPSADRTKAEFKRDAFSYDEEKDVSHYPNEKELRVKGLYRSASGVYWKYWADCGDCQSCPFREKYLSENDKRGAIRLLDTSFRPTVRRHLARQNEPDCLDALRKRQIWWAGTLTSQLVSAPCGALPFRRSLSDTGTTTRTEPGHYTESGDVL